ncbi:MAG: class I SAM-dependent methyltransferase [Pseudomonadota bacterium]
MSTTAEAELQSKYETWNRKLSTTWSAADYAKIGVTLQITGEELAEAADFKPNSRVLDVAAGNGNASLALARRFCLVTSTDYVPEMLEKGRKRAEAEDLEIKFEVADAQNLQYSDESFDGVISTFGVMFAPGQASAASEVIRVCKPGGKIALACWTPSGFVGRVCATIGRHMSASSDFQSPQNWGREEWLQQHFGTDCASIEIRWKSFNFRYRSPQHFLTYFRQNYGLMRKAFEHVGEGGESALADDILAIANELNQAKDGTLRAPSSYAEIVMVKR